jgi:hypothetical protein
MPATAALTATPQPLNVGASRFHSMALKQMTFFDKTMALLSDSHFLIPLITFCIGLALLIVLH